jgi:hypothetical protein
MNTKRFILATFVLATLFGCAQERDAIDRTQPNYQRKSLFEGEWYYQRTVIDVPLGETFTYVGDSAWPNVWRITWDIQENFLYGRRSTELVQGGDDKPRTGDDYEGEVVAAYRILQHFDRTYAYNPTTGERLNIIEENAIDRPWYEREYLRVDWSQNLVTNAELFFENASAEPVPYFVQDYNDADDTERHPHAPYFEGDGSYFDITNKIFGRAGTVNYPPYGDIPLCWFTDVMECGAGEYTIRNSFLKLDPNEDYQGFPYKGKMTEAYGFFWTDRFVFDSDGLFIQNQQRWLNRYNIWQKVLDADGNELPYSERRLKPIVYWVNDEWPDDDDDAMTRGAIEAARQWNVYFEQLVTELGYPLADDEDVFILCHHNPVQADDPAACGEEGFAPRLGDLRYPFLAFVPDHNDSSPLGLGAHNVDPENGRILSAGAYIYERNNAYANRTAEMIEILNGTRNLESYIGGVDLTDWHDAVTGENNNFSNKFHPLEAARHMVQQNTAGLRSSRWDGRRQAPTEQDVKQMEEQGVRRWMEPFLTRMYNEGVARSHGDHGRSKLARLAGTEIESILMNEEMKLVRNAAPDAALSEDLLKEISPFRGGGFSQFLRNRYRFLDNHRMERNQYFEGAMDDDALMGMANKALEQNLDHDELVDLIRYQAYVGVIAHEIGHTIGLMHNFGGSDDVFNYHDGYWALRDDGNVGPRITDPISQAEIDGEIYKFAQSTTMDYSARYGVDDALGLGKYDRAAIFFGYGGLVEVMHDTGSFSNAEIHEWHFSDGDPLFLYGAGPEAIHYTTYYNELGSDMYSDVNREWVSWTTLEEDFSQEEGRDGRARVPYIYCSHSRYNLGDSCLTWDYGADPAERMQHTLDQLNFWYIERNFPRGRVGVDSWTYAARAYRNYDRLKQWHDLYGLYLDLMPQWYDAATLEEFYMDPTSGWGIKTWAVQNAFNHLVQTILMPDVNDYVQEVQADGVLTLVPSVFGGGTFVTDVSNARYFSTSWFNDYRECGYMFWECMHHIGFYLDKIMAIEAMSDSETNFVGRSSPEDVREWEISYYSTFGPQLRKINNAILGQRWNEVGPYWEGGEMRWPNYAGEMSTNHVLPVDPFATFTIQLYWQAMGRARFPNTYDRSFEEESRVFIMGTGLEPQLDAERLVSYTDPITGLTYCAVAYDNVDGGGETAINRANAIKARSHLCDDTDETDTEDDDCRSPELGLSRDRATAELHNWNEVLKVLALMDTRMEWGDPYNP